MDKLNIYHFCHCIGFNTLLKSKKKKKIKKKRKVFLDLTISADRANSGTFLSLVLKLKEIDQSMGEKCLNTDFFLVRIFLYSD